MSIESGKMVVVGERRGDRMVNKEHHHHDQVVTVAFHREQQYEDAPHAHYSMMSPLHMATTSDEAQSQKRASFPCSPMRGATDGSSSHGEAVSTAVIRAQEIQSKLVPELPSFVKSLVRSHVASCFWMGLPVAFCKRHLPDKDTTITLEDESGKEYKTKYIACKTGLSAGWRQFSAVHKLQEGDVVVFQLVEPTKLKVYIIRANKVRELDGALLNLDSFVKPKVGGRSSTNTDDVSSTSPKRKFGKSVPQDVQKKKKTVVSRMGPKSRQSAEPSENNSEEEALSEILEGFKMLQFKDIKGIGNFTIIVDGMLIDTELPNEVRTKYYKLCHSQQVFLHENLIKGMNCKLISGIISETVHIADAIKVSVMSTPRVEFTNWDKTLHAFEYLGMNVAFLRHRLRRLVSLAYESEDASEARRYLAYRTENSRADEELKNMEAKLEELKGACHDFGAYLESLKSKAESYQHQFQKEVAAPW